MRFWIFILGLLALAGPCLAAPQHVIVITMENKDAAESDVGGDSYIFGNLKDAPYLNTVLAPIAARAENFIDELPRDKSQPHYILMEAGRSSFDDTTFKCDNDPLRNCDPLFGRPNWTKSREHLTAQMAARKPPLSWMTYQEGIDEATTGACPIHSSGFYAAKHNPFVYFGDVAGEPPDASNANCIAHTRKLSQFAADMAANALASYVFITPNLCNDMHGARKCPKNDVATGDGFLRSFLPPLLDWAERNKAVVFIVWDEGSVSKTIPFYAAGWGVRPGHVSKVRYAHRSVLKTIERIFGLPALDVVKNVPDLEDMFEKGVLP